MGRRTQGSSLLLESGWEPPQAIPVFPPSLSHVQDPPWLSGPCWREGPGGPGEPEMQRGSRKTEVVPKDGEGLEGWRAISQES